MRETDLTKSLSHQLVEDGYLLLRSVYDPVEVNVARQEILERLAEVGEVKNPISAAIFSGTSRRRSLHPTADDLGEFWKSVSEGPALRAVINGPKIINIMEKLFGSSTAHFSFAWLRAMQAGRASPMHIDHPYMNRGTDQLVTCWSPIGPVNIDEGSLYILEGSHNWREIRNQFEGHDVDRDKSKPGHIQETPLELAQQNNSRFLTTSFNPGDCLIFGMFTVHGSFDNNSQIGRIRLSCDTRFQPAAQPMDPRFSGVNPLAHDGLGYSCLSAALPMDETSSLR
jgi:ectoine hydroxylase-related dioxygenase (phytanoyl-CoA dioxygenase family)